MYPLQSEHHCCCLAHVDCMLAGPIKPIQRHCPGAKTTCSATARGQGTGWRLESCLVASACCSLMLCVEHTSRVSHKCFQSFQCCYVCQDGSVKQRQQSVFVEASNMAVLSQNCKLSGTAKTLCLSVAAVIEQQFGVPSACHVAHSQTPPQGFRAILQN
jgi:hypothetical protein